MNVWIISGFDPVPGIDNDTRLRRYGNLAQTFEQLGHSVVFWTSDFAHWKKAPRYSTDATKQLTSTLRAEFLYAPPYRRNASLGRVRHNRRLAASFSRHAEHSNIKPDVIVAEIPCLELAEAAAHYALRYQIPFICDIQDIWPEVYLTVLPRLLWPIGRVVLTSEYRRLRRILRATKFVTAVSKQYLNWAAGHIQRPIGAYDRVFPLGYCLPTDADRSAAISQTDEFLGRYDLSRKHLLVTFLGQFGSSYDVATIVAAASRFRNMPHIRFVLAGAGDKSSKIVSAAAGQSNVILTGWLGHIDTISLLGLSRIGLAAYTARAAQSLPYKPFEYMAYGLPIVSSLSGELREIIEQNRIGCFYQAASPDSLADAIWSLAKDENECVSAGNRSRALFDNEFDANKIYLAMAGHIAKACF